MASILEKNNTTATAINMGNAAMAAQNLPELSPTFVTFDDLLDLADNKSYTEKLKEEAVAKYSIQKSFWRCIDDTSKPSCTLEAIACELFEFHTKGRGYVLIDASDSDKYEGDIATLEPATDTPVQDRSKNKKKKKKKKKNKKVGKATNVRKLRINRAKSGVEWWVQVRGPNTPKGTSLGFHWDENYGENQGMDLERRKITRRNKLPWLSTVSYMSDLGAPTVAVPISPFDVEQSLPKSKGLENDDNELIVSEGYVSFPKLGKHMAFNGHYLHGVPAELVDEEGNPLSTFDGADARGRSQDKPYLRVTFLVNIWINTGPPNCVLPNSLLAPILCKSVNSHKDNTKKDEQCQTDFSYLRASKRGRISEVTTDYETPVCGFGFGKSEEDSYQFWMPVPARTFHKAKVATGAQRRSSFKIRFNGGEESPCFICRA